MRDGNRIRRAMLAMVCSQWRFAWQPPLLEIGSGDGTHFKLLQEKIGAAYPSDRNIVRWPKDLGTLYQFDARAIPFENHAFSTIFSANVLEHIPQVERALVEMKRVLRPGGMMIHLVPTVTWKSLQLSLYHMDMVRSWGATGKRKSFRPRLVHGIYADSLAELKNFRDRSWRNLFLDAGFIVMKTLNLLLFSPYRLMPDVISVRKLVGRWFPSCRAYLLAINAA